VVSFIDRLIYGLIWLAKRKRRKPDIIFDATSAAPQLLSLLQGTAGGSVIARAVGRCGLARTLTF
jgi:hypothetical protein